MNGLLLLVLVIAILIALYFYLRPSEGLERLAAKANSAAIGGRDEEAEKFFGEIIRREAGLKKAKLTAQQQEANRRILGHAFLGLGEIIEKRNPAEAFQRYRKARKLGAPLSAAAWKTLAEGYAEQHSKSDNALGAYLAYIRERPPEASSLKVYAALESACQVDEDRPDADRKQAIELNHRVLAANPDLEWPYYYLGVACVLDGNLTAALTNLEPARKLNPNRAMTYYWIGTCHLRQTGGSLDAAIDALSRFVAFPPDSPQMAKRQGQAAFEMAKRLIGMIGGFRVRARISPLARRALRWARRFGIWKRRYRRTIASLNISSSSPKRTRGARAPTWRFPLLSAQSAWVRSSVFTTLAPNTGRLECPIGARTL